jgi:hypothetical protein
VETAYRTPPLEPTKTVVLARTGARFKALAAVNEEMTEPELASSL